MASEHLRERDLRRLAEFLPRVYALRSARSFGAEIIRVLPDLIDCDTCSYNELDLERGINDYLTWPSGAGFAGDRAAFNRHIGEHPIYRAWLDRDPRQSWRPNARKISDYVSLPAFFDLGIYSEYFRRLGLRHQIGYTIALRGEGRGATIAINRARSDFDERDRRMLNLLRPHLMQAADNADAIRRIEADLALLTEGLAANPQDLALLAPDGSVRFMSEGLRRSVAARYGERSLLSDRLPEEIERWLAAAEKDLDELRTTTPLALDGLVLRLARGSASRLLIAERSPAELAGLGLTQREAEVLSWICRGKTNAEIAAILELSRRTVEKHSERIFPKLGVESRAAAISFVHGRLARTRFELASGSTA